MNFKALIASAGIVAGIGCTASLSAIAVPANLDIIVTAAKVNQLEFNFSGTGTGNVVNFPLGGPFGIPGPGTIDGAFRLGSSGSLISSDITLNQSGFVQSFSKRPATFSLGSESPVHFVSTSEVDDVGTHHMFFDFKSGAGDLTKTRNLVGDTRFSSSSDADGGITISACGEFIDGCSFSRIFDVESAQISLSDVSLQDAQEAVLLQLAGTNDEERQAIKNIKHGYGEAADRLKLFGDILSFNFFGDEEEDALRAAANQRALDIKDAMNKTAKEVIERAGSAAASEAIKSGAKTAAKGAEMVATAIKEDPPRSDFDLITERSDVVFSLDLADMFGAEFADYDSVFVHYGEVVEFNERILITLERLQGAVLFGDVSDIDRQALHFEELYEEMDLEIAILLDLIDVGSFRSEDSQELQTFRSSASALRFESIVGIDRLEPIPVPATLPLMVSAVGLIGFAGYRRRKSA